MKSIELNEVEIQGMITLFEKRIQFSEKKTDALRETLNKLKSSLLTITNKQDEIKVPVIQDVEVVEKVVEQVTEQVIEHQPVVTVEISEKAKKKAEKALKKAEKKAEKKAAKRGRKPKIKEVAELPVENKTEETTQVEFDWKAFIINQLSERQILLSAANLTEGFIALYGKQNMYKDAIQNKIATRLKELQKLGTLTKKKFAKITLAFFGLSEWLDADGEFEATYVPDNVVEKPQKNDNKLSNIIQSKLEERNDEQFSWPRFVLSTLRKHDRPLIIDEFVDESKNILNFKPTERKNIIRILDSTLKEMVFKIKDIKKHNLKGNIEVFALPDWFDDNNLLMQEYVDKIVQ